MAFVLRCSLLNWALYFLGRNVKNLILVVDESGAKGYSDQSEKFFGETGVMAGFLFHEDDYHEHEINLNLLRTRYLSDGKLHITDLDFNSQSQLREDVLKYLIDNEVVCVFEAIYSEGFYKVAQENLERSHRLKQQRKSKIKLSGNDKKEMLHAQLFQGVFGKAVAYGLDTIGENYSILVKTDFVDDGVLSKLTMSADEVLNVGEARTKTVTGWDTYESKVVSGSISSQISDPAGVLGDFSGISYEVEREDSAFTLVADVISNTLYRHLANRPKEEATLPLNYESSIPKDMDDVIFYGISDENDPPYYSDIIFRHPERKI